MFDKAVENSAALKKCGRSFARVTRSSQRTERYVAVKSEIINDIVASSSPDRCAYPWIWAGLWLARSHVAAGISFVISGSKITLKR